MKIKLLLLTLFSITSLAADGYRIEVKKVLDSNAQESYLPNLILPISWSENLSSSLEYRSGETTDERKFSDIDNSIINELIEHNRLKLNAINYTRLNKKYSYSIGIGGSYEVYDKTQKGYFVDNLGYKSDYDNSIDISIISLYLKAEGLYRTSYLDMKLYALVVPYSALDVTQNTVFSGSISKSLTASSSETQNINYEMDLELITKLDTFIDFGINAKYRFLPLDYSLDTRTGAKETNIEEEFTLLTARILFNVDALKGWMPSVGYSSEVTYSKDISDSSVREFREKIIYVGVNTRF